MTDLHHQREYSYFVDGIKYTTENSSVTGAYIISQISGFPPGYALMMEGHGDSPDELVTESTTIRLDEGERHFYTVPPASFGLR